MKFRVGSLYLPHSSEYVKGEFVVSKISKLAVASCLISLSAGALAIAPDFMDKLAADSRPMEDKARDGARRPDPQKDGL